MIGALPPVHELARQTGIDLPNILGTVSEIERDPSPESPDQPAPTIDDGDDNAGA